MLEAKHKFYWFTFHSGFIDTDNLSHLDTKSKTKAGTVLEIYYSFLKIIMIIIIVMFQFKIWQYLTKNVCTILLISETMSFRCFL